MVLVIQCDARGPAGIYGEFLQERKVPHRVLRLFDGLRRVSLRLFDTFLTGFALS